MKKTILSILFFGMLFTACENKSDKQNGPKIENTSDIKNNSESEKSPRYDSAKTATTLEYMYKSDNGETVPVAFFEVDGEKYVEVKREGQAPVILEQISASATRAIYEKENYKWISQNDEATFTNGINFLKLTLVSPLKYTYTNGREDIAITYFSTGDKRFVTIQKDSLPAITLEQTSAWAKGAEYGKGPVQWHSHANTGTLIEDGMKTEFKEKE